MYLGEYTADIIDGRVEFPWMVEGDKKLVWQISESTVEGVKSVNYSIIDTEQAGEYASGGDESSFKILHQGEFTVDDEDMWEVPEEMKDYFESGEIIFFGMGFMVEMMSPEEMEKYNDMMDDIEDIMDIIDGKKKEE